MLNDQTPQGHSPSIASQSDKGSASTQEKRTVGPSDDLSTSCVNCKTKKTPLWRRAANGDTLCNACGLYLKTNNAKRPTCISKRARCENELDPSQDSRGTCPGDGNCNGTGGAKACDGCPVYHQQHDTKKDLVCFNCHTTTTPLWRKDREGNIICNACGLFYKLNNSHRPVTLKTSVIKRRKRVVINKNSNQEDSKEGEGSKSNTCEVTREPKKEAPVPSIEDFPFNSFKKKRGAEHRPKQVISFSSEGEEQSSNTAAPTISPSWPDINLNSHNRSVTSSIKPPTPEDSYTCPSTLVTSECSPSILEPHPTNRGWSNYPSNPSPALAPPVIDRDTLIAHRNKIQQEVENLNRLLSSTSSILQGIDRLIYPPEQTHPSIVHTIKPDQVTLPPLRYVTDPYSHVHNSPENHYQYLPTMYPAPQPPPYYSYPQNFR